MDQINAYRRFLNLQINIKSKICFNYSIVHRSGINHISPLGIKDELCLPYATKQKQGRAKASQPWLYPFFYRKYIPHHKECSYLRVMVLLSGHNSKKYQAALQFKMHIAENQNLLPIASISEESSICNREIDEFGELAAKRIRRVQKRLTPEDINMLILEYQSGKTPAELSERFGCHRITVCRILKRHGIYESPSTKLHEEGYAKELIIGYQAGKSVRTLAKELGEDSKTISRILKEYDIVVNKCRTRAKVDAVKVAQMYEEMHTTKEIAQHFGVSPKAILTCLREHGVKIRSRWDYAEK